jgi:hypothetical protein
MHVEFGSAWRDRPHLPSRTVAGEQFEEGDGGARRGEEDGDQFERAHR